MVNIAPPCLLRVSIIAGLLLMANLASAETPPSSRTETDPSNRPVIGLEHDGPIKVVYQISEDKWKEGVSKGLLYLKKLRGFYAKQGIPADQLEIRAVFHGDASTHLLTDDAWNRVKKTDTGNPNTKLISELTRLGIHLELCDARRREEGWEKIDVHPDVLLAAAAYARIIDLQMQGYAYIKF
ncbi:DsrE family protein [Rubinisphaera margarita]|uniref:DsrE family protein n=1 Tax=Rubinisphaera margarita TaxID=2909586 RepID=UPI001EE8FBC7|nr:DsrE family protein [Rubinisphaera margarita]MCG6155873.1 DsrE family protein [Rubinisphaera margarita]